MRTLIAGALLAVVLIAGAAELATAALPVCLGSSEGAPGATVSYLLVVEAALPATGQFTGSGIRTACVGATCALTPVSVAGFLASPAISVGLTNYLPTGPTFGQAIFHPSGPSLGPGTGKLCQTNGTCIDLTLTPQGCG